MAGAKGRSGRKPKSVEEHLRGGSFRMDRHRHLLQGRTVDQVREAMSSESQSRSRTAAAVVTMPDRPVDALPSDMSGSALAGRLLAQYGDWSDGDRLVLSLLASQYDRLVQIRKELAGAGLVTNTRRGPALNAALLRAERQTTAAVASLIRQLNLQG